MTCLDAKEHQAEADALFLGEDLNNFTEFVRLAGRAKRMAALSFAVAVVVTLAAIVLAIGGKLSPQWALAVRFILDLALIVSAAQLLTPLWKRRSVAHF